ncbi:uncharacterized protein METZ01_LOCUS464119, partial [marine metagenome]
VGEGSGEEKLVKVLIVFTGHPDKGDHTAGV